MLAVDQLEEIFTACRDEAERAAFADALGGPRRRRRSAGCRRARDPGRLLRPLRRVPELAAQMGANTVLVGSMRRDELRRAIELPAKQAGLRVEPSLVAALVGDVAEEPAAALLSTTLVELWEERSGRTLREASYAASGGVSGAVARLAERAYRRLSGPQRERARAILVGRRRGGGAGQKAGPARRARDRARPGHGRRPRGADREPPGAGGRGTVEVAHEALLSSGRLRAWLDEDAEGRRLHQHLIQAAREWQGSGRDPGALPRRPARLGARVGRRARARAERARARLPRREPGRERARGRAPAAHEPPPANALAGVGVLLAAAVVAG